MRNTGSEDDYEARNDFFDPFWVLFADDDSDNTPATKKKSRRKPQPQEDNEGSGVFNYFMSEDDYQGVQEEREPTEYKRNKKNGGQKKQHYWRRNQPKKEQQRVTFARNSNSKRSIAPVNIPVERRDLPSRSIISVTDDGTSVEENDDIFPTPTLPNFMEALTTKWDPWGDRTSSSDSSAEETDLSDETSRNDDSTASASNMSGSLATNEKQEVQQILVQFNPLGNARAKNNEVTTFEPRKPTSQAALEPDESVQNLHLKRISANGVARELDESAGSLSTIERIDNREGLTPYLDFNIPEDEKSPSSCLNLANVCGTGKNRDKKNILTLCRKKTPKDELGRQDLATIFPKLRMVADDKATGIKNSAVVANKNFKGNVPAHLQLPSDAFLTTRGPQSLYEYEYEGGEHMDVAYNHFGPNPLSLLVIRHHSTPPRPRFKGAVVQVEASTISMTDCSMRSGEWMGKDTPPLPITPGVDMVGKIFRIDKQLSSFHRLAVGDRVISLTRCGGNSRFLSIDPDQLVKISNEMDPAEAACLAETYLSAFQVLHFGQSPGIRYRNNALKGKSILILGAVATTLGHAIVELASIAGVEKILATASPKHFPHLRSLGIIPVSVDPSMWYDQLNGEIDLVLVSNANEEVVTEHFKVLSERGHLIVIGQRLGSGTPIRDWESKDLLSAKSLVCKRNKVKVNMIDRTHEYNPFRQWDQDLDKSKRDLSHLVKLLEKGDIKPNVLDRIPLNKVAKAQEMVESQRHPAGFLVCEPWLRNKKRAVRL